MPIVKFTDKSTATKVDVSINIEGALTSAEFIKVRAMLCSCLGNVVVIFPSISIIITTITIIDMA